MVCSGCRGYCERKNFGYKIRKAIGAYFPVEEAAHYKRCSKCELFIKTDKLDCPCCNIRLHGQRRFKKGNREKYKEIKNAQVSKTCN